MIEIWFCISRKFWQKFRVCFIRFDWKLDNSIVYLYVFQFRFFHNFFNQFFIHQNNNIIVLRFVSFNHIILCSNISILNQQIDSMSIIYHFFVLFNRKFRCCLISNINIHVFSNFVWNKINDLFIFLSIFLRFFKQKQILCWNLRRNFNFISIHHINSCWNNKKWQI